MTLCVSVSIHAHIVGSFVSDISFLPIRQDGYANRALTYGNRLHYFLRGRINDHDSVRSLITDIRALAVRRKGHTTRAFLNFDSPNSFVLGGWTNA